MVSMEKRKLIVFNAKRGMGVPEMSEIFQVGKSTIWKLLKREKETGSIEPQYQGKKSSMTDEQYQAMLEFLQRFIAHCFPKTWKLVYPLTQMVNS